MNLPKYMFDVNQVLKVVAPESCYEVVDGVSVTNDVDNTKAVTVFKVPDTVLEEYPAISYRVPNGPEYYRYYNANKKEGVTLTFDGKFVTLTGPDGKDLVTRPQSTHPENTNVLRWYSLVVPFVQVPDYKEVLFNSKSPDRPNIYSFTNGEFLCTDKVSFDCPLQWRQGVKTIPKVASGAKYKVQLWKGTDSYIVHYNIECKLGTFDTYLKVLDMEGV